MDCQSRMHLLTRHFLHKKPKLPSLVCACYASNKNEDTLKYQNSLPTFPVPPLKQTLEKYLLQYKPHVSQEEYERTKQVVLEFGKHGGVGELLQNKLEQRKEETENWCYDWWTKYFLAKREPNVLTYSPCSLLYPQNFSGVDEQLQFSAKVLASLAETVSSLARHQYPPAMVMGTPLCMDQYYKSMCSCRIPAQPIDKIFYRCIDQPDAYRHVIIMRNNQFFKLDLLSPDMEPIGPADILQHLKHIVDETKEPGIAIGLLTSLQRNRWAEIYSSMAQDEMNAQSFHDIQSSIAVCCLDETETFSDEETKNQYDSRWGLCGGGSKLNSGNRWFDKGFLFAVGTHGETALYGDHTLADGVLAHAVLSQVTKFLNNNENITTDTCAGSLPPKKLEFAVDDFVNQAVEEAGLHIDQYLSHQQIGERTFKLFGKKLLKSKQINPDGFIQVAIQMTYLRQFGFLPVMFEASSLQLFKLGRIEHLRTVTEESVDFIKTFTDKDLKSSAKLSKLQKAIKVHMKCNKEAKFGQGMERHLFGLQKIAEEYKIDASKFFGDPSWKRSSHVHIRTSNIPGNLIRTTFLPGIPQSQSFCMWYSVRDDHIQFTLSTTDDKSVLDVRSFLECLYSNMREMQLLAETEI
ncbi:carnitine O-acetyltransferase-like isoform X3 [Apostichopus japonicus]